ncbi:unnamed protein product, partial [Notodromas monacha]
MEESAFQTCGMNGGSDSVWVGLPQTQVQTQQPHSLCYLWLSSVLRIIRKRLVLGLIFVFSLSYFLISLHYGSRSMGLIDDNSEELSVVPKWQKDGGGVGNFPWRSPDDDRVEVAPPLDADPTSNDTLRHLQGGENPEEALPKTAVAKSSSAPCRNSVQGLQLIADDRGFVCKRDEVLPTGCCDRGIPTTSRYVCESCLSNHCCKIYEH